MTCAVCRRSIEPDESNVIQRDVARVGPGTRYEAGATLAYHTCCYNERPWRAEDQGREKLLGHTLDAIRIARDAGWL